MFYSKLNIFVNSETVFELYNIRPTKTPIIDLILCRVTDYFAARYLFNYIIFLMTHKQPWLISYVRTMTQMWKTTQQYSKKICSATFVVFVFPSRHHPQLRVPSGQQNTDELKKLCYSRQGQRATCCSAIYLDLILNTCHGPWPPFLLSKSSDESIHSLMLIISCLPVSVSFSTCAPTSLMCSVAVTWPPSPWRWPKIVWSTLDTGRWHKHMVM